MASYVKYYDFSEQLCRAKHDFGSHTYKVALSNTAQSQSSTGLAGVTEISAGAGYTAGGTATTIGISETTGTTTVTGTQVVFTSSGAFATFQYVILYNDTATSPADALVAYWDYGSAVSLANGDTFTVKFNNADPGNIFTLA